MISIVLTVRMKCNLLIINLFVGFSNTFIKSMLANSYHIISGSMLRTISLSL